MRVVEDSVGRSQLLLKRSGDSSLVRDIETGEERFVPTAELSVVEGADPLEAAARAVSPAVRRLVRGVHDERGLGLLVTLAARERTARGLLGATDVCESDLHGLLAELRAAGLVEEATVDGEAGYAATPAARRALAEVQSEDTAGASVD